MLRVRISPIVPKTPIVGDPSAKVNRAMLNLGKNIVRRMATYPPQQSKVSASGRSIAYRRTGTLGRGWKMDVAKRGGMIGVEVRNAVPYSGYVEGYPEEQVRDMRRRGWPSLGDVSESEYRKTEAEIERAFRDSLKPPR